MWSLRKYRGKWAAVATIQGRTVRRSSGSQNREHAEQWFDDFVKIQNAPRENIEDIFNAYKEEKSHEEQRKLTIMWKHLKPFFGSYRPDQIDRDKCKKYTAFREGKSNNTIIRELGSIRAALRWYDKSLPKTFWMPQKPEPKDQFITREQFRTLLEHCDGHTKLFVILAIATAGRTSAILELTWDQIDLENRMINLGTGNRIKRRAVVPMNDMAHGALNDAYNDRPCEYVVSYAGRKIQSIRKGFDSALVKAKIKRVTPHALRHSAARWMAEGGCSMSEIAQYLGHSSTSVTEKTYARYSPNYLRKAADILQ